MRTARKSSASIRHRRRRARSSRSSDRTYTVGQAIADYVHHTEDRATGRHTADRLALHVPASMKAKPVDELTKQEVTNWHRGLAKTPPRARPKAGGGQSYRDVDMSNPETIRRRKVTANAVLYKLSEPRTYPHPLSTRIAGQSRNAVKSWSFRQLLEGNMRTACGSA